jgi:hypothetical protein
MSEEAYDCIVSCLGSSATSKILKGVPKGDGAGLLKKLHTAKGSVEHQIQRWDSKLDRLTLTLVTMNGWIDFRDEWLEAEDGRNNVDELEEDDILSEKVLFRKFYKKLSDVFPLIFQSCVCGTAAARWPGGDGRFLRPDARCSGGVCTSASCSLGWAALLRRTRTSCQQRFLHRLVGSPRRKGRCRPMEDQAFETQLPGEGS